VSTVRRFRHLARDLTAANDAVLEIGCSTGETTAILAKCAGRVVAVDISQELVARTAAAMAALANVMVRKVDARNIPCLVKLLPRPDLVFIDVGGVAQVDNVAFVLRQCLQAFSPRMFVVRNTEMAAILSLVERVEIPLKEDWPFAPMTTADEARMRLENLLAVSRSVHSDSRVFAAKRLKLYPTEPLAVERLREMVSDPQPRVSRVASHSLSEVEAMVGGDDPAGAAQSPGLARVRGETRGAPGEPERQDSAGESA
jgi:SAM-dependent methyltransferase